ncbi:MAG: DMT family transporter [Actinomyces graevenitzii]|jgi:integral membrane protein|uniref:Putative membrane protein n=1 Tax=Actinomyces graevenitzii F0530 TaxID=1321817 RepID=U1PVD2_9ACTO|nr:DMT family transporter [Actinomyces graevenitzii]ERH14421.1 putative membrane protein [Actinomyces graevenitzii F0530]MBS5245504.1 DMT family transporter [Actinomyces graevenitzii]PMC92288.1 EamA/RhaT family transporter [Actinomyces graevenitzii]
MRYGIGSGALWGLDTVILAIALALNPFATDAHASLVSAALHDAVCALILLVFMAMRGRLKDTWRAIHTRSGRAVMVAALLGGPIGMSGYLLAIDQIGAGYTAIISTFYPALGTALAVLVLKERMRPRQVIALAVAIGAIIATSYTSTSVSGSALWGVLGALAAVVGWGCEAVILAWGMRDDAVDNETALQIRETTSGLTYLVLVVPLGGALSSTGQALTSPGAMGLVALAAAAGTASYLFYYKAIDLLGAARAMALNISYSAWAVLFAFLLQSIVPAPIQIVLCVVILVGTVLAATENWRELTSFKSQSR